MRHHFKTGLRRSLLALVFCLASVGIASAQEITGTIVGTVRDANGAAVPGATVTITNTDKNLVARTLSSNENGEYSAPLLPIGNYQISVEAPNFKKFVESKVKLDVNQRLTKDVTLEAGNISEVITVESAPLAVDLQTPTAAGLITGTQVRELSINNRNYEQLVALMPGVSSGVSDQIYVGVTNPSGLSNQINFSVNGNRPTQNNWTIDGADNVDRGANLTLLNYPSIDAIEEFKVLRGLYNPEFGRSSGGEINVITRSGTSKFHGSGYEFFRNDKLNANNYFSNLNGIPRPPLRYNNFGYTIGGPVTIPKLYNRERNKTFFFFSQEFRRVITYSNFTSGELPTAAERQGIFSSPVCLDRDCSTSGMQVTNINPVAQAYLKDIYSKVPLPGPDGTISFVGRNIFNFRQETVRIDHYLTPKFLIIGRYMNDSIPTVEPGGLFTGSSIPGLATTNTDSPGRNFVLRGVMTFSPSLINEVGYAYSYGAVISTPVGLLNTANSPDIKPVLPFEPQLARVPSLAFNDGEFIGGFGPYRDFNRNHNIFDTLTKIAGGHSMKFGVTFHRYQKDENDAGGAAFNVGQYSFDDTDPNGNNTFQQEFANFLLGNVAQFAQTNIDPRAVMNQKQFEAFAQDEWRIRRNLTLTYGVRYSLFYSPTEENGHLSSFDPAAYNPSAAPAINRSNGNLAAGTPTPVLNGIIINNQNSPFGARVARTPKALFAPRFGLAWDPFGNGKTSVRTGYGIFYDSPAMNVVENNVFSNPPFVKNITISNTTLDNPGQVAADVNLAPNGLFATQPDWKQPYTQEWSFDVQRQLTNTLLLDVGYYGAKGTHLVGVVDINEPAPRAYLAAGLTTNGAFIRGSTTPRLNFVRPYRGFGAINMFSTRFDSNYNSLQMQVTKRFSGNSLIQANYTWSHALTDSQSDFRTPQNSYDFRAEYGAAQFDRRHIFTADYVYELPWFRAQRGVAGHILGGWEISGITTLNSGLPLTVTGGASVDPAGLGLLDAFSFAGRRPDQIGDPNANAPHTRLQWFNKSAFANVPAGQYRPGSSSRGSVKGPGIQRWDVSLFKNTRLTEGSDLQFRLEAFNVFNHTNFNTVRTTLQSSSFGRVLTARDARVIQLGLKFRF